MTLTLTSHPCRSVWLEAANAFVAGSQVTVIGWWGQASPLVRVGWVWWGCVEEGVAVGDWLGSDRVGWGRSGASTAQ